MKAADDIFNGKEYAQLGTLFTHHMIFKDKGPFIKYVMQEGEGIYQSVRVKVQICTSKDEWWHTEAHKDTQRHNKTQYEY